VTVVGGRVEGYDDGDANAKGLSRPKTTLYLWKMNQTVETRLSMPERGVNAATMAELNRHPNYSGVSVSFWRSGVNAALR